MAERASVQPDDVSGDARSNEITDADLSSMAGGTSTEEH